MCNNCACALAEALISIFRTAITVLFPSIRYVLMHIRELKHQRQQRQRKRHLKMREMVIIASSSHPLLIIASSSHPLLFSAF